MPSGTQYINLGGHVLPLQICPILNFLGFVVVAVVVTAAAVWFLFLFLATDQSSARLTSSAVRHTIQIYMFISAWYCPGDSISESCTFPISTRATLAIISGCTSKH